MALPASGQISFDQIRIELNVPTQSPMTMGSASAGLYGALQQCASPFVPVGPPNLISHWHGYNHNATASLTFEEDFTDFTSSNCTDACLGPEDGSTQLQAFSYSSSAWFGNSLCTTGLTVGYYANVPREYVTADGCYTVSSGVPATITSASCAGTTTTTTTTLAAGLCWSIENTSGVNTPTALWTSLEGTGRSGVTAVSTTYGGICSSTTPLEQGGAADLSITPATDGPCSCTNICTTLACKICLCIA